MSETNPIVLVEDLKQILKRYIATVLPISRRYPNLASRFRQELDKPEHALVAGPFVEALPDFEKGNTLAELTQAQGGFLHNAFAQLPTAQRRLHLHQQQALEAAVKDGKSLLVATGTGSGKTEAFLYPIVHALLSDPEPTPGVRALLIYPMNALANDQLYYRIAPLLAHHLQQQYKISFGRYTGQIKANTSRAEEESRLLNNSKLLQALGFPAKIPDNWRLTREEMLDSPPKVLITNYAMLEHLLLLPRNARLFAVDALKMVVLDEIHTYRGAQATEVAFLLRKLKNRLGLTRPLQVFGTSASLAEGAEADEQLKIFASGLFGEAVHTVIRGKRIIHARLQQARADEFTLSGAVWIKLGQVLADLASLSATDATLEAWNRALVARDLGHLSLQASEARLAEPLGIFLEQRFAANRELRQVAAELDQKGVMAFHELAQRVFPAAVGEDGMTDAQRYEALSAMMRMGMLARSSEASFPLLPGRYHIAANGIEGVAVQPIADSEGWGDIKIARHGYNPQQGHFYPLFVCRKCGQPYLEGFNDTKYLHPRRPEPGAPKATRCVFWLGQPSSFVEDEDDESSEAITSDYPALWVNPLTAKLSKKEAAGTLKLYEVKTKEDSEEQAWYVRKCPACGGLSGGAEKEIITPMHPGDEALGSVITQRVLEALPGREIDHTQPRPAAGRNLLLFSDNRQDAAFFAPYFERTAAGLALRSAIYQVLTHSEHQFSPQQLAQAVVKYWRQEGQQAIWLDANGDIRTDPQAMTDLILGAIGAEFCTPAGRRNSLEALGVAVVSYSPDKLKLLRDKVLQFWPAALPNDLASVDAMILLLLDNIRREKALAKFYGVDLKDEFIWGSYSQHRSFDIEGGDSKVLLKWLPPQEQKRENRRTGYLCHQLGLSRPEAFAFLRQFWEALVKPPLALLLRHNPGFALDAETLRIGSGENVPLYVCKSCGLQQWHVLNLKCTAFRCEGEVELMSPAERQALRHHNHYWVSYAETNHVTLRAREHTAALSTDLRERIEQEFSKGEVNVLSCTTTMEMGVDLGDLEAVVNLNVPPGIANYQQRTGRAGRRAQAAPFCVTLARNTNYDQLMYRDFKRYLSTQPSAPLIHLGNAELFWRHQQSVLLSHYLRYKIADPTVNAPTLEHLFGNQFPSAFMADLQVWLASAAGNQAVAEAEALSMRLPDELQAIGKSGEAMRQKFLASLRELEAEVSGRYQQYGEKIVALSTEQNYRSAAHWQNMQDRYLGQFLVNQLSSRGLIPTYSFPVHSLSLEVTQEKESWRSAEVVLSRDASQGISEYAPGAEVVANGRIWVSQGLAYYPKQFMPVRYYAVCPVCSQVDIAEEKADCPQACSHCGCVEGRFKRPFIEPRGFVTDYDKRKGRDTGSSRRRVKVADEARLIASPQEEVFIATEFPWLRTALLKANGSGNALPGALFIVNRGQYGNGYYRCALCNYAEPQKNRPTPSTAKASKPMLHKHSDPLTGKPCPTTQPATFGLDFVHQFNTDVRLFRFSAALPPPPAEADEVAARRFEGHIARTLTEALRLAAIELLQLQPGEIRAIYRLAGSLEVVMYDGVPSGAGYCERLGAEARYSFAALLKAMRHRLDCPVSCDSGCRLCLCDYGNQRYWDSFERIPALAWLDGLLAAD